MSVGGKWTSARADAADAVDRVCELLGRVPGEPPTGNRPFPWSPATDSGAFEREDLLTLYDYARATATAEDDLLVRELEADNQHIREIGESLAEQKRVRERHYNRLQELEGVRRRFKQQRYDSVHSGFRNEGLVGMILGQFLQGTVTAQELWRTLEREQRYRRMDANPDFGSGGFRPRPGTWHIPFPRGGGLGGGMRIPRGMPRRGGGGFRTGGGF